MVALFEVSLLTLFFERRARGKKVRLNGLPREGWRTCPQSIIGGFLAKIKWVEFMDHQKDARAARGSKSNLKTFKIKINFENILNHFTITN